MSLFIRESSLAQMDEVPVIEDDVNIGAGAAVIGPITVGKDAVIGANAVVTHDVPAGAVVAGNPAHIIK